MEIFAHIFTPIIMLVTGFLGMPQEQAVTSVELDLVQEVSPRGQEGGLAMPASGCAYVTVPDYHDNSNPNCTDYPIIELDPTIVRSGEDVEVSWEIGDHEGCVLRYKSYEVAVPADGTIPGIVLTAETTFYLTCDEGSASVVGKVLPKIQET